MPFRLTGFSVFLLVLFLLPWLVLIGLGGYWLWLHDCLYQAIGLLTANSMLAYALLKWRQSRAKPLLTEPFSIPADANWPDQGRLAFDGLQPIIDAWQDEADLFVSADKLLRLSNQVLTTVARQFHAESKYPILEFPLPYLLRLVVLVCEDLQREVLDKIPGSHAVSIGDFYRAKDALSTLKTGFSFLNAGGWLLNPAGAALNKARSVLLGRGFVKLGEEISRRLVGVYVKKLGYYAIQLYSGQITLETIVPTEVLTGYSNADFAAAQQPADSPEPLRILLLGQVSSGKSTLLNALFGEIKAAENWLPTTANVTPYVLEREGLQRAIILDSAGYGGLRHAEAVTALQREWAQVDLILLVCHAVQAARQADRQQLDAIRTYFRQNPQRAMPVVIAVASHIDQLRPLREWLPPYNIRQPDNAKAGNIRAVCRAIAAELQLPLECIVPVCMNPVYQYYNIDDGLLPLIYEQLDDIRRVRYLRCLGSQQSNRSWTQWRKQLAALGKLF